MENLSLDTSVLVDPSPPRHSLLPSTLLVISGCSFGRAGSSVRTGILDLDCKRW